MFQKLITYSIRHKLVVGVFTIALIIWGIVSLIHLPFDSTPDITDNQVQVITQAPSLGAILPTIRFRSSPRRLRSERRRWSNMLPLR